MFFNIYIHGDKSKIAVPLIMYRIIYPYLGGSMGSNHIILHHLWNYRWQYLIGFIILTASCLLQMAIPILLGQFTDQLDNGLLTKSDAVQFGWLLIAAGLGIAITRSVSRISIFRLARMLETKIRNKLFKHWERLSAQYFNNSRIGDLMSHAINDVNVIREASMQGIFNTIEALVLISVVVLAMVWTIDPYLTLFTMLPLPLLSILAYLFSKKIQKESKDVQSAISTLTSRVQEFVAGIGIIKSFVREEKEKSLFSIDNQYSVDMNKRLIRSNSLFISLTAAIVGFSFLVSLVMGGIMVLRDIITLGNFVAFNTYLAILIMPIENLGKVINIMQRGKASEKRLLEIFQTKADVVDDEYANEQIDHLFGDIEIKNLSFSYPESNQLSLDQINLKVPKGSSLAIVGRVGSGKSTLINLLVRLYNPLKGTFFLDGHDILEIPLQTLRSQIGIVPQDQFLFSSTIADNIKFDPHAHSEEEMVHASKVAQVYNSIIEFPQQFETRLGERGVSLSGGQRQRVSIARAIIKKPSILIFDDSLSAVDTETEDLILEGLQSEMNDRTTIIIGHRISSVKAADQIVVLDEGKIVEKGTHESLLKLNGLYADTYQKQLLDEEAEKHDFPDQRKDGEF